MVHRWRPASTTARDSAPTKAYPMDDTTEFTPAPIPTEAELASFDYRTVPSPVEVIGDVRITAEPSLESLPPEMRDRVNAKLTGVAPGHRDIFERQFVMKELEDNSHRLRVLAGPGKDANAYQRECYGIEREIYDLEREALRIEDELADVVGYRTEHDTDGNPVSVEVYRFAPETRAGRASALQDVRYRIMQVQRESAARRAAAAKLVAEEIAAQNQEQEIFATAKAQALKMLKQERIDHLAAAFAKNRRNTIG